MSIKELLDGYNSIGYEEKNGVYIITMIYNQKINSSVLNFYEKDNKVYNVMRHGDKIEEVGLVLGDYLVFNNYLSGVIIGFIQGMGIAFRVNRNSEN